MKENCRLVGGNKKVTADIKVFRARYSVTWWQLLVGPAVCYLNTQTLKCTEIRYFIFCIQVWQLVPHFKDAQ